MAIIPDSSQTSRHVRQVPNGHQPTPFGYGVGSLSAP
jgi:hypothetical protein